MHEYVDNNSVYKTEWKTVCWTWIEDSIQTKGRSLCITWKLYIQTRVVLK